MKPKYSTEDKINYVYGLLSTDDRMHFEQLMREDPSLHAEIQELTSVIGKINEVTLVHAPEINPDQIIRRSKRDWTKIMFNSLRYAAIFMIVLIAAGSISNVQFRYDDTGISLSMSIWPQVQLIDDNVLSPDATVTPNIETDTASLAMLKEFQLQQAELLNDIIAREREDQRRQLQEMFTDYATMIENRRIIDLQLIQYELDELARTNDHRLNRTDLVLSTLLESISLSN